MECSLLHVNVCMHAWAEFHPVSCKEGSVVHTCMYGVYCVYHVCIAIPMVLQLQKMAPKPPPSAYVLFCNAKRDKLRQKHPDLPMKQIMQKLGEKWKALGVDSQSKYRQQNQEHLAKYHLDVVEFYDEHPEAVPPPRTAKLLERLRCVCLCV